MRKIDDDSVFSLRLPRRDAERLQHAARARGVTISRMAREAIAVGLQAANGGGLSYGITSNAPLSISMVGFGLPATTTSGGLAAELTE